MTTSAAASAKVVPCRQSTAIEARSRQRMAESSSSVGGGFSPVERKALVAPGTEKLRVCRENSGIDAQNGRAPRAFDVDRGPRLVGSAAARGAERERAVSLVSPLPLSPPPHARPAGGAPRRPRNGSARVKLGPVLRR